MRVFSYLIHGEIFPPSLWQDMVCSPVVAHNRHTIDDMMYTDDGFLVTQSGGKEALQTLTGALTYSG